ncbi:tripartite tricarboxylate transporter substrate binding protein [Parapusillimonas sp. SGNA-6]|nr:tripartite tricarboxylate transporter substrate binding protein [Parapusillimonas sp. SGNA-6]
MKFINRLIASAVIGLSAMAPALAGDFPSKPVRLVVPFSAGSATDILARTLSERLSQEWGQPVVVENKAGANGFIASSMVARAPADGYTILITANTTHAGNVALFKTLPYDPVADFEPLGRLGNIPLALVINPSIPANNVKELIAYIRANPGRVFFGSGSTSARVGGEMLKSAANLDMVNAPYKSNPEAVMDLIGGHVQMMIADVATTLPPAKAGQVKALAVASAAPTALAPDLPTIAESGDLPGFEMVGWFAAYAPAKTPADVVQRINSALVTVLADKAVGQRLHAAGIEAQSSTPEDLAKFQATETEKWKTLVQKAGIPVQ